MAGPSVRIGLYNPKTAPWQIFCVLNTNSSRQLCQVVFIIQQNPSYREGDTATDSSVIDTFDNYHKTIHSEQLDNHNIHISLFSDVLSLKYQHLHSSIYSFLSQERIPTCDEIKISQIKNRK
jgi:hypothetical protein